MPRATDRSSRCHDIGRMNPAEAEPIGRRYREQPDFRSRSSRKAAMPPPDSRGGEHRLEAADPIAEPPQTSGLRGRPACSTDSIARLRRRSAGYRAKCDEMPLGIASHAAGEGRDADYREHRIRRMPSTRGAVRHRRTRTRAALVARAQEEAASGTTTTTIAQTDHRQAQP